MYAYEWDPETGGYILLNTQIQFSKEPRPVYYRELDTMGFGKYWSYERDDNAPYMWAEANNYFYRGRLVARSKGGSIYSAPEITILEEPEPDGGRLRQVDIKAMLMKNSEIMETLVQSTIQRVYNTYVEYQNRIDVFYVAFSGGKDSVALLDIVQRTLPHDRFKVLFGDTGMEFPDTYVTVAKVEQICTEQGIEFLRSSCLYDPGQTWREFGPPATTNRWCCSVHKTAPQIIALREELGKSNFTGMAFVGVRGDESLSRSTYSYVSLGEKHKGQYSCNPILEWNSAELYLYIYERELVLNEAYKKGNRRAGCLVCPRAAERNEWMAYQCYPEEVNRYIDIIREMYAKTFPDDARMHEFIGNGGWKARKNGRDLILGCNYQETRTNNKALRITIDHPKTDWREWMKTIGILHGACSPYELEYRGKSVCFDVYESIDRLEVLIEEDMLVIDTAFAKLFKEVFRKAASCVMCMECMADCHNGCLHMENGNVYIDDRCVHCAQCHKAEKGCLVYKSISKPQGGTGKMADKSINVYSHHAPKMEWLEQFFTEKDNFLSNNTLGSQMLNFFKTFLRHTELVTKTYGLSETGWVIDRLGLDDIRSWGIMLVNLAYTPQVNWYIMNTDLDRVYNRETLQAMMPENKASNDVCLSLGRLKELPLSNVGLGTVQKKKNKIVGFTRTAWSMPDPHVVLYALYKLAEKCGAYHHFTLSWLMNEEIERDGISPAKIFGLSYDTMKSLLIELAANYPDYIGVAFTHDLDNINLNSAMTSADVLKLF